MRPKKKTAVLAVVVILVILAVLTITDRMTNNKLKNGFGLAYLYLTSSREVAFGSMLIKVPYYYTKNIDQESLVLLRFPNRKAIVVLHKTELVDFQEFFLEYTNRLEKLKFAAIKRASRQIGEEPVYVLSATKAPDMSDYKEYVYIPFGHVVAEFFGEESSSLEMWEILESIRGHS